MSCGVVTDGRLMDPNAPTTETWAGGGGFLGRFLESSAEFVGALSEKVGGILNYQQQSGDRPEQDDNVSSQEANGHQPLP